VPPSTNRCNAVLSSICSPTVEVGQTAITRPNPAFLVYEIPAIAIWVGRKGSMVVSVYG